MRAWKAPSFRSNLFRVAGIGALSLHLAAAQGDCVFRIVIDDGDGHGCEGEGEGEANDVDGDGLFDSDERALGTDPNNPDSDFDGLLDGAEAFCAIPVAMAAREDGADVAEAPGMVAACCTDPLNPDSDFDGIPDGADSCDDPWGIDSDFDGLFDVDEYAFGTDPYNPDSDGDGLLDGNEAWCAVPVPVAGEAERHDDSAADAMPMPAPFCCTDPLNPDSDFDGIPDGADVCEEQPWLDSDGDGLGDADEQHLGTDPYNADSDFDGLFDGAEVWCITAEPMPAVEGHRDEDIANDDVTIEPAPACCTDPLNADSDFDGIVDGRDTCDVLVVVDSDGDGLDDDTEARLGTDPYNVDTDGDRLQDGAELALGFDPNNPDSDGDGILDGEEALADAHRER
jgi:hypothetical protein